MSSGWRCHPLSETSSIRIRLFVKVSISSELAAQITKANKNKEPNKRAGAYPFE
jgi:hypothetical protein